MITCCLCIIELVVYGLFERKLSLFSTFVHFTGCSVWALMMRNSGLLGQNNNFKGSSAPASKEQAPLPYFGLTMGTAPPHTAATYYAMLVLCRTVTQELTNLSMTQINYPAKVLFKSINPVITMLLGLVVFRKTYSKEEFLVVLLLVTGLGIFLQGDMEESPQATMLGTAYVLIALCGSAAIPMIAEYCMDRYNATTSDMLYHTYIGSTLISLVLSVGSGEFTQGIGFLSQKGGTYAWFCIFALSTTGFLGSNCSTLLTARFGALVNSLTNTGRRGVTLALSFLLFPERNSLSIRHGLGLLVFFSGLIVKAFTKSSAKSDDHQVAEGSSESVASVLDIESKGAPPRHLSPPPTTDESNHNL